MLDDLVSVVETLQQRIRDHGAALRENETRTRMALIDPLLTALGWDVSDPALVTPEYNVSGRWADYALLRPDSQPAATIEAKKLGESLASHRMQMLNYSNASGVEYAGLTDGDHWELYEVFHRGQLEDRRILDISIADMSAHELALKLLLLWRSNLGVGQPVAASAPVLELDSVPQLTTPISAPPEPPDSFAMPEPSPVETPIAPEGWVSLAEFDPPRGNDPPQAILFPDGDGQKLWYWNDILVATATWLHSTGRLIAENTPVGSSADNYIVHNQPIHPTGRQFKYYRTIADGLLAINTDLSAHQARRNTQILLRHCGVSPNTVQLQVGQ